MDSKWRRLGWHTFIIVVLAVESTLQFIWTTILSLDLVVE
jgi:hypothetical protein